MRVIILSRSKDAYLDDDPRERIIPYEDTPATRRFRSELESVNQMTCLKQTFSSMPLAIASTMMRCRERERVATANRRSLHIEIKQQRQGLYVPKF